jgi:hypothetical protein
MEISFYSSTACYYRIVSAQVPVYTRWLIKEEIDGLSLIFIDFMFQWQVALDI